jgi:uncharacterized protein
MLLEFRFRNFRSFRGEAVLSFAASTDTSLADTHTVPTGFKTPAALVRAAGIYGANASGKTNVLKALEFLKAMVLASPTHPPGVGLNAQPFHLAADSSKEPTSFELTVLLQGARYRYGFEHTAERITAEWLFVSSRGREQRWFERSVVEGRDAYAFGPLFTGSKKVWQEATRPNVLFLSNAVQLNSEQLLPLHQWLAESLVIFHSGLGAGPGYSTQALTNQASNAAIRSILTAADIAISAIRTEMQPFRQIAIEFTGEKTNQRVEEGEALMPVFKHTAGEVSADFALLDESMGTQKLFALAGPLLDILANGRMLVVDELDGSLHPLLVRKVIEAFQDPEQNTSGAQLLFTSHDTSLLDQTLFRRDQLWLTDKGADQSSQLVPLLEFSPRKGEALERGYLSGRYGGVPILGTTILPRKTGMGR